MKTAYFLAAMLLPLTATAQNESCYQAGWKKGWCDANHQTACIAPVGPIMPALPNRGDCQSRFADGYTAGYSFIAQSQIPLESIPPRSHGVDVGALEYLQRAFTPPPPPRAK